MVTKSEVTGEAKSTEVYSDEGLTTTVTNSKGVSYTEVWPREVDMTGWFKVTKTENMEAYNKALGFPAGFEAAFRNMTMQVKSLGKDRFEVREHFAGDEIVTKYTYDEEFTASYPKLNYSRSTVVTKLSPCKLLSVSKGPNGEKEEWTTTMGDNGGVWEGVDRVSGQSCKFWVERFTNITGKYRLVTSAGYDAFGAAMGMPADLVSKLKNDFDATITISDQGNCMRMVSDSKVMPMDLVFKWNEEFDFKMPGTDEVYKASRDGPKNETFMPHFLTFCL